MYESEKVGDLCKGEKLAFARREVIERPSQGWQDEMSASGAITVIVHRALEAEESGEEYMSGSEAGSDGEESDQAGLEGNPGPDEDGSGADEDGPLAGPSGRDKSRKSKKTAVAPVKQDSKVSLVSETGSIWTCFWGSMRCPSLQCHGHPSSGMVPKVSKRSPKFVVPTSSSLLKCHFVWRTCILR